MRTGNYVAASVAIYSKARPQNRLTLASIGSEFPARIWPLTRGTRRACHSLRVFAGPVELRLRAARRMGETPMTRSLLLALLPLLLAAQQPAPAQRTPAQATAAVRE